MIKKCGYAVFVWLVTTHSYAVITTTSRKSWGDIAVDLVAGPATGLARLMHAVCMIAGVGFLLGSVMQYKQYRDHPTQVRISTPIMLFCLGIALILIPLLPRIAEAGWFLQ